MHSQPNMQAAFNALDPDYDGEVSVQILDYLKVELFQLTGP